MNEVNYPEFVMVVRIDEGADGTKDGFGMRHVGEGVYYRDAGDWSGKARYANKELIMTLPGDWVGSSEMKLIKSTLEAVKESNAQYWPLLDDTERETKNQLCF